MDQEPKSTATRFLTNGEAAAFLKLSPRTLEKLRVVGGGPRFRKFGRRVLYKLDDLDQWADGRACDHTSDPIYQALRG
jgi:excisionase family DNA binding protein